MEEGIPSVEKAIDKEIRKGNKKFRTKKAAIIKRYPGINKLSTDEFLAKLVISSRKVIKASVQGEIRVTNQRLGICKWILMLDVERNKKKIKQKMGNTLEDFLKENDKDDVSEG